MVKTKNNKEIGDTPEKQTPLYGQAEKSGEGDTYTDVRLEPQETATAHKFLSMAEDIEKDLLTAEGDEIAIWENYINLLRRTALGEMTPTELVELLPDSDVKNECVRMINADNSEKE